MTISVKHFTDLSVTELFEIYKLRVSVFVVEQNCPYQEVDELDKVAFHVILEENGEILGYARVLPPGTAFPEAGIGRVISVRRRQGTGTRVVEAAIKTAYEKFSASDITLEAQVYARKLYENLGFAACSDEFLEDGIPHIKMTLKK